MTTVNDRTRHAAIKRWDDATSRTERAESLMQRAHADRRAAVRSLRRAGLSLRAAADVLGVSHTTVAKYDTPADSGAGK